MILYIEEAFKFYKESKQIFKLGGFNLWKFITSSSYLQLIDQAKKVQADVNSKDPTKWVSPTWKQHS